MSDDLIVTVAKATPVAWKSDDEFSAWLSGLIDGEGCFEVNTGLEAVAIRFVLRLRADDIGVLKAARARLGGIGQLSIQTPSDPSINPVAQWGIGLKELAPLVKLLDRFPPKSKKSRDFNLWRQAFAEMQKRPEHRDAPYLRRIGEAVIALRPFNGSGEMPERAAEQLNLLDFAKHVQVGRAVLEKRVHIAGSVAAKVEKLASSMTENEFAVQAIANEARRLVLHELDWLAYEFGLGPDPRD